jgi:class 3 adenylate cyclase
VSEAQVVPSPENLKLSNEAKHFERATIFYADLSGSTQLVDSSHWQIAGEVYKTYLLCAAKLIRSLGGTITAYDGDRVMAVFIGDYQTSTAAKCGLQLHWAIKNVVRPSLKEQYPTSTYTIKHVVGIDTCEIRAARIGIRGGNDLVWIGRAANYAAKLTESRSDYPTFITSQAYARLADWAKFGGQNNALMWTKFNWTTMYNIPVYGSNWTWSFS